MRVYIPYEGYKFCRPEDMEKIMTYLRAHGEVKVSPKTIEDYYYDFSETRCAGWLIVDEETLEAFADFLAEIEL